MTRRPPSFVALAATVVIGAGLALPAPATARAATAGSLSLSDAVVAPGATVALTGNLPPQRSRTVKLQRRTSDSWVTLVTSKSTSTGRFSFSPTAPTSGQRVYRVLAPATTLGGKRYAAVATPSRTLTVVRIVGVDAGWRHACAVGSNGSAWCWGDNTYGELGDGKGASYDDSHPQVSRPTRVVGTGWRTISTVGASSCGLKADHTAWCWGDHASWVSGVPKAPSPVRTTGLWNQVATSWAYACGVHTDATGWCWGRDDGQLGTSSPVPQGTKHQLPGAWLTVVPGSGENDGQSTCGIRTDHTAWCWGNGPASTATPTQVSGGHRWSSVSVSSSHTCGIDTDGVGWCWGGNTDGRLGDGTFTDSSVPVKVVVADHWTSLDAGLQHTCGVTTTGAGWCWGWNSNGQVGDGTATTDYYPTPKYHRLDGTWTALAAGHQFTAGSSGGFAWAWGASDLGQTGVGRQSADRLTPRKLAINP